MTILDQIVDAVPGMRDALGFLDEALPFIIGIPVAVFFIVILVWTFYGGERRAVRFLQGLTRKGFQPVDIADKHLRQAVDSLTPIMFHTYELATVTDTSDWRIKLAYGQESASGRRYIAHINRGVSRSPRQATVREHQYTAAFYEARSIPIAQELHIIGDHYSLDPGYGLQRVKDADLGDLAGVYLFYTADGVLPPLPGEFRHALLEVAPFLSITAGKVGQVGGFLFNARLKFTPRGWALISNQYIYHQAKLDRLLEVVDKLSRALR